jgi:hypothetical protein
MLWSRISLALAIGLVMAIAFATGGTSAANSPAEQPPSQNGRLDPKSNPLAMIDMAYRESGYDAHQAVAIAHRVMGLEYPDLQLDENSTQGTLDPKSNGLAVLHDLFLKSGWPADEAVTIAREALGLEDEDMCAAYLVYVTYCSGGVEKQGVFYLNARCYEDPDGNPGTADGLNVCDTLTCLPGSYRWLSLTTVGTGGGCGSLPGSTCVQMRVVPPSVSVDCARLNLDCACFQETTPTVNCSAIEQCCCSSSTTGCSGCPSCTSPCPSP